MGQTVRNPGRYDRLYVPGASGDKRRSASKIEYLEDRRRAKIVPFRNDTLQYDFNFTRATGELTDRLQRSRFIDSSSSRSVPRPQGVGGRRQTPERRAASNRTAAARKSDPRRKDSRDARPAAKGRPAPAKGAGARDAGRKAPRTRQADPGRRNPRKAPGKTDDPRRGDPRAARPDRAPRGAQARNDQAKKDPRRRDDGAARQKRPVPKGSKRPQRETVTDFRSVGTQKKEPKPRSTGNKNGHGRKLTPTYDLREKAQRGGGGAPVIEGGVLGFDMVDNSSARAPESPVKRRFKAKSLISAMLSIAIIFALLCMAVALNAQISDYSQQNAGIEKNIGALEEEISKLKMEIALQEDLGNIQQRAAALGMAHPEDSQVEFVDLSSTDVVKEGAALKADIHRVSSAQDPEPGFLETVGGWLASVFQPFGAADQPGAAQPSSPAGSEGQAPPAASGGADG